MGKERDPIINNGSSITCLVVGLQIDKEIARNFIGLREINRT